MSGVCGNKMLYIMDQTKPVDNRHKNEISSDSRIMFRMNISIQLSSERPMANDICLLSLSLYVSRMGILLNKSLAFVII